MMHRKHGEARRAGGRSLQFAGGFNVRLSHGLLPGTSSPKEPGSRSETEPAQPIPAAASTGATQVMAVSHRFRGAPVPWRGPALPLANGTCISLTRFEYLVSNLLLERTDGTVVRFAGQVFHMNPVDGLSTLTLRDVPPGPWRSIEFTVGLDRTLNRSDPRRWPAGHILHPCESTLGWGWKEGYIFLAAEGYAETPFGTSPSFLYHLGEEANRTEIRIETNPPAPELSDLELVFHVDRLWSAVSEIRVGDDETLTHSSDGDYLASRLSRNLSESFEAVSHVVEGTRTW